MNNQLFGTDGIRGKANEWPITPEVAMRIGRAVARVLCSEDGGSLKVVIGKDTRLSGYMLENALTAGLVSEGARVLLTGPVPTPAVAHLTKTMGCDAGIMLTASHNPFEDNGIKIFGSNGYKLTDELESEIEKIILSENLSDPDPSGGLGKAYRIDDAVGRYIEFAKNAVGAYSLKGFKVVLDCAHGASYFVGPLIFDELGAEVIKIGVNPNGRNINEGYGALHPKKAAALVAEHQADIGICFDGDADRVIFVDENGEVISGDRVLCLCAKALKEEGKLKDDCLVATVMSNLGLRDALEEDGIKLEVTGVGDRLVIESMRENGYSLGGENSGHIIFSDNSTTGDGIMSALKVLAIMKRTGKKLSELAACMEEYPAELHGILVKEKPPIHETPQLRDAIADAEKAMGNEGRVLVRYSGTENKIRVLVEAKSADAAKLHTKNICDAVHATIGC
ncbi:MAG: phosphoglucosamine mutase [Akkermansiaceae bacterium]